MSNIPMNKFEIVDLPGMKTVAFAIEKNNHQGEEALALQKIDAVEELENGKNKKTFYVLPNGESMQDIVLLTLAKNKAILNTGAITEEGFVTSDSAVPLNYGTIYSHEGAVSKEFAYTPNMKRIFSIVDAETGEEVKPVVYIDKDTNQLKGKCNLMPNKPYIALQVKLDN